jgi:hypothetical protein
VQGLGFRVKLHASVDSLVPYTAQLPLYHASIYHVISICLRRIDASDLDIIVAISLVPISANLAEMDFVTRQMVMEEARQYRNRLLGELIDGESSMSMFANIFSLNLYVNKVLGPKRPCYTFCTPSVHPSRYPRAWFLIPCRLVRVYLFLPSR